MRDVQKAIYERLVNDSQLSDLLAAVNGQPAVYYATGRSKSSPYIVFTWVSVNEEYHGQVAASLQIDVVDAARGKGPSVSRIMDVRDRVVDLLDDWQSKSGSNNLRMYFANEGGSTGDEGRWMRHFVEFDVRYFRHRDILNE